MRLGSLGSLATRDGDRPRPGAPAVVALPLLALALAVDLVVTVIPAYAFGERHPLPDHVGLLVSLVAFAGYAAVVALVGRTTAQRIMAVGLVLLATALHVAFYFVLSRGPLRPTSAEAAETFFLVRRVLLGLLLVGAWCAARRVGRWWWVGLSAVLVLLLAQFLVRDEVGERIARLTLANGAFDGPALALHAGVVWAWSTLALVLGGLACWAVDLFTAPGTTTARHPRG